MKKLFTFLFALSCVSSVLAAKYDCKIDGIYYNLNSSNMTATVTNKTGNEKAKCYSDSIVIPSSITWNQQTYSVTTIGERAFSNCSGLTSITIPHSIKTIGGWAFEACIGLTSITIPKSVTAIGYGAFWGCGNLTSVILHNPIVKIAENVFLGCTITNLYCGNYVNAARMGGKIKNIHRLSKDEFMIFLPFDQYARQYVETRINEWQKKKEFEKTEDWQKRVNETTRKQQIDSLVLVAKKDYLANYQKIFKRTFTLGIYDADNEVYLVQSSNMEDLLVAVPFADASYVKQNWGSHIASPQYEIQGTEVVLMSVAFSFPNNKTYSYKPDQKLTYSTPDINYNFDPIELPEMQTVTMGGAVAQSPQAPQNPQYISSIAVTTPFDINAMSSVLVSYQTHFSKLIMPDKDEPFPYTLFRVKLTGAPNMVRLAKQILMLNLGQMYQTEQTVTSYDNLILFLIPVETRNVYLTCGDGCERQLIYSGWLLPNKIYDGTIEVK